MNTPDTEWSEAFTKLVTGTTPDKASVPPQWINFITTLLTSRDTYWKERFEAVEAVLMEQYKNALQSNEDGEANGYAHSLAIVKDLHREFIHEDNMK